MQIKARLVKLESKMPLDIGAWRIARFVVSPKTIEPSGYQCDGVIVMRHPGEPVKAFEGRCIDAVHWPDTTCRRLFEPLRH